MISCRLSLPKENTEHCSPQQHIQADTVNKMTLKQLVLNIKIQIIVSLFWYIEVHSDAETQTIWCLAMLVQWQL